MRRDTRRLLLLASVVLAVLAGSGFGADFVRGDVNQSGDLSVADVAIILKQFLVGGNPNCRDAADTNDDGQVNFVDGIFLLEFLIMDGAPAIPAPFPFPGPDPTPDFLDCINFTVNPAQPSSDARFEIGVVETPPGADVTVPVVLSTTQPISTFSFGLTAAPELGVVDAAMADDFLPVNADLFAVDLLGNDAAVRVIVDFPGVRTIAPGAVMVLEIDCVVDGSLAPGPYDIRFDEQVTNPPVLNRVVFAGTTEVVPDLADGSIVVEASAFRRGDAAGDGTIDLADVFRIIEFLYAGAPISCLDTADANDDGFVDLTDPVYLLYYLFRETAAPPAPFPACGVDPTADDLGCELYTCL